MADKEKYRVLMINDVYTPMEFVVEIMERFFGKTYLEATRFMLEVHVKGGGVCGILDYDEAKAKIAEVTKFARDNNQSLQFTMERAD